VQLSTGNLCRQHIAAQTEIGREIAFAIKSGKLIPDSLITDMVQTWLVEQLGKVSSIILDGFPRAVAQASAFDVLLKEKFPDVRLHIVRFLVPDEEIVARLTTRLVCANSACQAVYSAIVGSPLQPKKEMVCDICLSPLGRRDDDVLVAVKERLAIYHKHTQELLNFYAQRNQKVVDLGASKDLPDVFYEFKQLMNVKVV
jgi:adenylate kinase